MFLKKLSLFVGVSFSSGLFFRKKTVVEEVIEYEDIVTKVSKVKRRIPASVNSETINHFDENEVGRETFPYSKTKERNESFTHELQEEGSSTYSTRPGFPSLPTNSLTARSLGSDLPSSSEIKSGS